MNFNLPQTATYWAPGNYDEYGKISSFTAPVQLDCRWQTVAKMYRDSQGVDRISDSIVYFDQDIEREGWLYLGTSAVANPRDVEEAHEIRQVDKSPNLRNTQVLYKAYL